MTRLSPTIMAKCRTNRIVRRSHGSRALRRNRGLIRPSRLEVAGNRHAVVTEYGMPGINGFELAQRIKRETQITDHPATGYAEFAVRAIN